MEQKLKDNKSVSLGDKLKEIRETFGVSKNVFASEAKIDVTEYTKIEEGEPLHGYLFLKKIITTYRINPCFLFDFQEEPPEGDKMEEKRTFVRFFINLKARYCVKEKDEVWEECTIFDVSRKGMGITFKPQINLGTTIFLAITVPKESEPLTVKGILKWVKQSRNCYMGGIELTELLDENQTLTILRAGI